MNSTPVGETSTLINAGPEVVLAPACAVLAQAQESTPIARIEKAIAAIGDLIRRGHPLSVSSSFGKDSTVVTILFLEAVRRAQGEAVHQAAHYVTSASTGVENPAMEAHVMACHDEIEAFARAYGLPVETKVARPSLAAGFVVKTIGQGTLPRFPENAKDRQCAVDWKVKPQQRLANELSRQTRAAGYRELVTLIGTRFEESPQRASRMQERGESDSVPVRDDAGRLVLSPIASWSLQDVWDALELFLLPETRPFPTFTGGASLYRIFSLYRDANEGQCGITLGDGGHKAPCGSRTGCAICTVTGERDKSMESMLREPKYAHLRVLNDFRNLLVATQWDFGRRELVGRTVSEAGYIPVQPDVYSLEFRRELLRYLITADVLEEERAEQVAEGIACGEIEDTPENRLLASPQFEMVSARQLVAVDFYWGMHPNAPHAFPAVDVWHEIRHLGRRYPVPAVPKTPKTALPAKRWFAVGDLDRSVPADGLRDYAAELWNHHRHPERPVAARSINGEPMVWFEEAEWLDVDSQTAYEFVTLVYPEQVVEMRLHEPIEGSRFLLNEGIVKLPKGMAARYQEMARRGQYFANLSLCRRLAGDELHEHMRANSIGDREHDDLVAGARKAAETVQAELFDDIEA